MAFRSSLAGLAAALVLATAAPAGASAVSSLSFTSTNWGGGVAAAWGMRFVPNAPFNHITLTVPSGATGGSWRVLRYDGLSGSTASAVQRSGNTLQLSFNQTFPAGMPVLLTNG